MLPILLPSELNTKLKPQEKLMVVLSFVQLKEIGY